MDINLFIIFYWLSRSTLKPSGPTLYLAEFKIKLHESCLDMTQSTWPDQRHPG